MATTAGANNRVTAEADARLSAFSRPLLYLSLLTADFFSIVLGFIVGFILRFGDLDENSWPILLVAAFPIFMILNINLGGYALASVKHPERGALRGVGAFLTAILILLVIAFTMRAQTEISRLAVLGTAMTGTVIMLGVRYKLLKFIRDRYLHLLQRILVLHSSPLPPTRKRAGTDVIDIDKLNLRPDRGDPEMLDRVGAALEGYDRVILACSVEARRDWALILKGANVQAEIVTPEFDALGALSIGRYDGETTLVVGAKQLSLADRITKRLFDLAIAVPAIIMLSPLLIVIAVAIKMDSRGPILFRQKRVGHGNRFFEVYKFRSMRVELTDNTGARSAARDDDRVTRVGRVLRSSSIDELPQLFNVLFGDMSIVGPRPHATGSLAGDALFWEVDDRYWHRHVLKPGITGLAQVRGFRGATARRMDLSRRLQADLEYVANWTVWQDVLILLRTIRVIRHANAF